jgi:hypothetical protein
MLANSLQTFSRIPFQPLSPNTIQTEDPSSRKLMLTQVYAKLSDWVLEAISDTELMASRSSAQYKILQAVAKTDAHKGDITVYIDSHDLPPALGYGITVLGPQVQSASIASILKRIDTLVAHQSSSVLEFNRSCTQLIADIACMKDANKIDAFNALGVKLCELSDAGQRDPLQAVSPRVVARIFKEQLAPAVSAFKPRDPNELQVKAELERLMGKLIGAERENLASRDRELAARVARSGLSPSLTIR